MTSTEDLELNPETQAALALVDLSNYHPTPDAATAFHPSPAPDHVTISLASTESSTTDSDSPILCAPQPARFIHHHTWNVLDVTPQSPSTEQLSQASSPAGLTFTDPLIADKCAPTLPQLMHQVAHKTLPFRKPRAQPLPPLQTVNLIQESTPPLPPQEVIDLQSPSLTPVPTLPPHTTSHSPSYHIHSLSPTPAQSIPTIPETHLRDH
jgi:hypothetical protein